MALVKSLGLSGDVYFWIWHFSMAQTQEACHDLNSLAVPMVNCHNC
jgi:hypothetical protein